MKKILPLAALLAAILPMNTWKAATSSAQGPGVTVSQSDQCPASAGPAETFTGEVSVKPLFDANAAPNVSSAEVTFTPTARTAWHTHPAGQTLIVTAGTGWVQEWGGLRQEMTVGDVVWVEPGIKHWHGATGDTAMTHIAIQGMVDGSPVDWMELVSDKQYAP